MHPVSCADTHHDVTDLINHGMVKYTKTWIPWGRNIIFLQNKKNQLTYVSDDTFWEVTNL